MDPAEQLLNFKVNEIVWNSSGLFYLANSRDSVNFNARDLIDKDSAGALDSLWATELLACLWIFSHLDWPMRTFSFSFVGKQLASASRDLLIHIENTETKKGHRQSRGTIEFYGGLAAKASTSGFCVRRQEAGIHGHREKSKYKGFLSRNTPFFTIIS